MQAMLTKYDIGKLKPGVRVKVGSRTGTVVSEHEPQWRDHRTRMWMHELQGADIAFDGDPPGIAHYIHCGKIEVLANAEVSDRRAHATEIKQDANGRFAPLTGSTL